jgi:hypothetical protein
MKLTRFNLSHLYNEEWFTYVNFLTGIINQLGDNKAAFGGLLSMLEKSAAAASEAMEIIRTSEYTRLCDEMDEKRDHLIVGINHLVRSFIYDEDSALREAAHNIMTVINHYRGMANEDRDQESGRIINFVSELNENQADRVAKLADLKRRLTQLSDANKKYIELQDSRTFSDAEQTSVRMVNVRREGDTAIRSVWNLTELMPAIAPVPIPEIEQFAARLDTENRNERDKLATRKGRRENSADTEEA